MKNQRLAENSTRNFQENPKFRPLTASYSRFTLFLRHFFGLWGLYGPFFVELLRKEVRSNKPFHRTAHQLPKLPDVSYDPRRRPLTVAVPVRCPVELDVPRDCVARDLWRFYRR